MFESRENEESVRTEKICGNCKNEWRDGDKYCRYCGAPMDHPEYRVKGFYPLYGPGLVRRRHSCRKCGYTWETVAMVHEEKYCPECGARVIIKMLRY